MADAGSLHAAATALKLDGAAYVPYTPENLTLTVEGLGAAPGAR